MKATKPTLATRDGNGGGFKLPMAVQKDFKFSHLNHQKAKASPIPSQTTTLMTEIDLEPGDSGERGDSGESNENSTKRRFWAEV